MPLFAQSEPKREPVDYVNTNIGGIGHLLRATAPLVFLPHGMVSLAPVTPRLIVDRYLADKIMGFPIGGATLMATAGPDRAADIDRMRVEDEKGGDSSYLRAGRNHDENAYWLGASADHDVGDGCNLPRGDD